MKSCEQPAAPPALATNIKLSDHALARIRAVTAELDEALTEMNRTEAVMNKFGLDLDAEGRKYHDESWWPSCKRHGVRVVIKGGRVFAGWSALASKCEELTRGCEVFDLDRVVVLD